MKKKELAPFTNEERKKDLLLMIAIKNTLK